MNNKSNKTTSAIIIIGNEILSGRTQDINLSHLSIWLNKLGVRVEEVRIIPDIEDKQNDIISEEEIVKAAHMFMKDFQQINISVLV